MEDFHISAGEGDQGTKLVSGRNLLENAEHKHRGQGFYVVNRNEPKLFKKKKNRSGYPRIHSFVPVRGLLMIFSVPLPAITRL